MIGAAIATAIKPDLKDFFTPCQYGVGVQGGAETVVQGLRIFKPLHDGNTVVGIDFTKCLQLC